MIVLQGLQHRIQDRFRISLVHVIEEILWDEIYTFQFCVGVKPESI